MTLNPPALQFDVWRQWVEDTLKNHDATISSLQGQTANLTVRVANLEQPQPPPVPAPIILVNRDLSTLNLAQYTHRDWGFGTDVGGNGNGAGQLNFHANLAGKRAAGLTVTPNSAAGGTPTSSDAIYLWDPIDSVTRWGYVGSESWLRTSLFFPSPASSAALLSGEAPFAATTGEWNWILEFHKDLLSGASPITFDVLTDYPVGSGVGVHPRLRLRLAYGNESSPTFDYKEAPALIFDHWYDFLIHTKFDPTAGILEWWLDGQLLYSNLSAVTAFVRSNGVPSICNLTVANYRLHASWASTFFIGPLVICPDKVSALGVW